MFCGVIVAPFVAGWLVFWLYANINSILLAFQKYNVATDSFFYFPLSNMFQNFERFVKDVFSNMGGLYFLNGAYFHILGILCLPISYMIAFAIYKKLPATGFFKVVLYLPGILSAMITILLYKHLFESGIDQIVYRLTGTGLPAVFTHPKYNRLVLSIYVVFFALPGSMLVNLGSMSRTPQDLIEYGRLEGISLWREFWMITVPLIYPVIEVSCLGLFVGFFTNQGPLFTFYDTGAPENIKTFGYYLYIMMARSASSATAMQNSKALIGYSSAAALTIGLVSIPIIQLTKKLFDKFDPEAEY